VGRELFAADALRDGRLVRLSPLSITHEEAHPFHLVFPPGLREWPPVVALRRWLREELERSRKELHSAEPTDRDKPKRIRPGGRSRTRARR
jgi:LysR family transcriptional regulator, glycine cleavage system transcriptional activator